MDWSPAPRPSDARPCTARDVEATFDGGGGAAGTEYLRIRFRNVSDSTCVLKGHPAVTGTEPGRADVVAHGIDVPGDSTADMAPGQSTWLDLATTVMCPAGVGGGGKGGALYHYFEISLPDGETITVHYGTGADLTCELGAGPFWIPEPAPPESPLEASLQAPASVQAGSVLGYLVDLTNTADEALTLSPCPVYEQLVGTSPPDFESLNCQAIGAIPAHRTVRFEMRFAVPADAPRELAKLAWGIDWPDGAHTATATVIRTR